MGSYYVIQAYHMVTVSIVADKKAPQKTFIKKLDKVKFTHSHLHLHITRNVTRGSIAV